MISKRCTVYSIIKTEQTELDVKGGEQIFSLLALYRDDDAVLSRFVYDIARNEEAANGILQKIQYINPCADALLEAVSEIL